LNFQLLDPKLLKDPVVLQKSTYFALSRVFAPDKVPMWFFAPESKEFQVADRKVTVVMQVLNEAKEDIGR
jgi:hypothetical protein